MHGPSRDVFVECKLGGAAAGERGRVQGAEMHAPVATMTAMSRRQHCIASVRICPQLSLLLPWHGWPPWSSFLPDPHHRRPTNSTPHLSTSSKKTKPPCPGTHFDALTRLRSPSELTADVSLSSRSVPLLVLFRHFDPPHCWLLPPMEESNHRIRSAAAITAGRSHAGILTPSPISPLLVLDPPERR